MHMLSLTESSFNILNMQAISWAFIVNKLLEF